MPHSQIAIIGAPLDLGQDRRGVDMGPSALRVASLNARIQSLGYDVVDLGNIRVEQAEAWPEGDEHAKYLPQIASACDELGMKVYQAPGGWPSASGAGRRSLGGCGLGERRVQVFPRSWTGRRADLAGRACRHEHARFQPERQYPRHAAGLHHGDGAGGTGGPVRVSSQDRAAQCRDRGAARCRPDGAAARARVGRSAPSPCAISTSVDCAP